jgi:cytochrome subunit of sulfide dehydrogenase
MMKSALAAVLGMVAMAVSGVAAASEPPQVQTCAVCHGASAPSPFASVPTIHGLPETVLDNAMYDFRATIRPCRKVDCEGVADCPDMDFCAIAAKLTDEDISALARWYSTQPFAPAGEPWDAGLAVRGRELHMARCESCHVGGGTASVEEASLLRGQRKAYLQLALEDFGTDRRIAVAEMHAKTLDLSPEEIAALVEYYASPREP